MLFGCSGLFQVFEIRGEILVTGLPLLKLQFFGVSAPASSIFEVRSFILLGQGTRFMDNTNSISATGASSHNEATRPLSDSIEQVRVAASALLEKAHDGVGIADFAAAVEKASGALKQAAEIDKLQQELEKLKQEALKVRRENESAAKGERSERRREYVALLTPVVTIVTLAATLVAQNWQFLRSERDKREEALDAQWRDAVKTISASGALSPGVVALQPFLNSEKYGDQAREAAVGLLANSSDSSFFKSLFGPALVPVTKANLTKVIRLDRSMRDRIDPILVKSWDSDKQTNDLTRLSKEELVTYKYVVEAAAPLLTTEIIGYLRTRPAGEEIDLSDTYFLNGDMGKIDFKGLNMNDSALEVCTFRSAELDGLTQFAGAVFDATAWWDAKSINRPLLDYLKHQYSFKPGGAYGPQGIHVQQQQYDQAVRRLESQLK
jgi:hypothetical protein